MHAIFFNFDLPQKRHHQKQLKEKEQGGVLLNTEPGVILIRSSPGIQARVPEPNPKLSYYLT